MLPKTFTFDQISEMIKKKIHIKETPERQSSKSKKASPLKFRSKQVLKCPFKKNQENLNNNIVIMNMPPSSKIDFLDDNFKNHSSIVRKLSHNLESGPHIFSNHTIFNGLRRFDTVNETHQLRNNFMNDEKQTFMELKRCNSLDVRHSLSNINSQSSLNCPQNVSKSLNPLFVQSTNHKISIASIEFKPGLRELLFRRNKTAQKNEDKMKKGEFNYQRAISTSCQSRKKAFQKVLNTFQLTLVNKASENPQPKNINFKQSPKFRFESIKSSRQISTSSKTRIGSPQKKKPKDIKQQQSCRPWSAGKKALIKLQSSEEQNPLQFYSINGNQ